MNNYEQVLMYVKTLVRHLSDSPKNVLGKNIYSHFALTAKFAAEVAERENADIHVVTIAAWLHDIATLTAYENYYKEHHYYGAQMARRMLPTFGVSEDDVTAVYNCILNHRGSVYVKPTSALTPEEMAVADGEALAHMCDIPGLLYFAYGMNKCSHDGGRKFVLEKLQISFEKLSDKSQKAYEYLYIEALGLLTRASYWLGRDLLPSDTILPADKIKAINPTIVVNSAKTREPYYSILYYDLADKEWHVGFSSSNLDYVRQWLAEYFDPVEAEVRPVKFQEASVDSPDE